MWGVSEARVKENATEKKFQVVSFNKYTGGLVNTMIKQARKQQVIQ